VIVRKHNNTIKQYKPAKVHNYLKNSWEIWTIQKGINTATFSM